VSWRDLAPSGLFFSPKRQDGPSVVTRRAVGPGPLFSDEVSELSLRLRGFF